MSNSINMVKFWRMYRDQSIIRDLIKFLRDYLESKDFRPDNRICSCQNVDIGLFVKTELSKVTQNGRMIYIDVELKDMTGEEKVIFSERYTSWFDGICKSDVILQEKGEIFISDSVEKAITNYLRQV